jgi:hypothetical protein
VVAKNAANNPVMSCSFSIAVGSKEFVESVKECLGFRAKGREVVGVGEGFRVREDTAFYNPFFGAEKEDISSKKTYFGKVNL